MFRIKQDADEALRNLIEQQKSELKTHEIPALNHLSSVFRRMMLMLIQDSGSMLTTNNQIKAYTDGSEKFADLIAAIKEARDHVHLEYYIWRDDGLSHELRDVLTERALAGVEVRVLCDGLGCARLPRNFFDGLKSAGGKIAFFFPSRIRFLMERPLLLEDSTSVTNISVRSRNGDTGATPPYGLKETQLWPVSFASSLIGTMRQKRSNRGTCIAISLISRRLTEQQCR
jgi:phosphatidylserine/phosphatidylglycerophosphate/cardiolipin synthase-like enzyme